MSLSPGQVFAGYTIVRQLGAGGMGEVYLAQHPRLPRQDAIKVLPPHLASDEGFRLRFLREADLASGLNHPNIVGVLDRGEEDGRLWLSMPYIDGVDAAEHLRVRPSGLPLAEVAAIVKDTASALDYAHRQGVLHRDVKPANILLSEDRALLSDFGIARAANDSSDLTATGTTIGSVAYAAPEQLRGEQVGPSADIYSLAATAYALLTGQRPFDRSNPAAVVAAALEGRVPSVHSSRPDLPTSIDAILTRGMSREPGKRPATAGQFAEQLANAPQIVSDPTLLRDVPGDDRYDATMIAPGQAAVPHSAEPRVAPPSTPTVRNASRRRWAVPALAAAVGLLAVALTGAIILNRQASSGGPAAASTSPSTPATPATGSATVTLQPSTVTISPAPTVTNPPVRPASDLGLTKPISTPPCDGRYIVVLVSIEESNPSLRTLIGERLAAEPSAQYFYSGGLNCNSINSVDVNGERFYTPYVDHGTNLNSACYAIQHREESYVRTLRSGIPIGTNPCG